jgi:hypothetical protein
MSSLGTLDCALVRFNKFHINQTKVVIFKYIQKNLELNYNDKISLYKEGHPTHLKCFKVMD